MGAVAALAVTVVTTGGGMTSFMTAYFGRDTRHAGANARIMKDEGFSAVVLPCSEERMRFDAAGVRDIVQAAKDAGLETYVSPWGVGGVFGGEGIGTTPKATWTWLEAAIECDPDGIYWDEPHGHDAQKLLAFLSLAAPPRMKQMLYWNPDKLLRPPPPAVLSQMVSVGMDLYDGSVDNASTVNVLAANARIEAHLWIKGFSVKAGDEGTTAALIGQATIRVPRVGVWGWRGSEAIGCLRCERPDVFWNEVTTAIRACQAGQPSGAQGAGAPAAVPCELPPGTNL